ncbi:aldo/keto reductase [Massilia soli]|uniref:Aldo/keto reductase n=1 Tax=Massilia soli TaxID=2792854 RepID=A0ABS7STD3_9BURK|nr:aldo/keto reductase [Massilia soli]MBZ2209212.1 aldo/keto reductase [Massilia soli]
MQNKLSIRRRRILQAMVSLGAGATMPVFAAPAPIATRAIPSSGEAIPLIGLGSWITFNVGNDPAGRAEATDVMRNFLAAGGRMIDSSPMYGSAQEVIGNGLSTLGRPAAVFSADKVWTSSGGRQQIAESRRRWGVPKFDLLQVHNLLDWERQLPLLFAMKKAGQLRYVGITTSEGRRHADIVKLMASQPIDFVQVTYNAVDREVEQRILPLARERKIAVIANRPFRQGDLTQALRRHPLPPWAAEIGCKSWAQVLLKFIVSHPDITCAIPATSQVAHVRENMAAGAGPMPDAALRSRISAHVGRLV